MNSGDRGGPRSASGGNAIEPLVNAWEVAERLGVSTSWVYHRWERYDNGDPDGLPGFRLGSGRGPVRFMWSEVERWLYRHRIDHQG